MVSHYFDSHQGGIEIVGGNLFRCLVRRGCEIVWAAASVSPAPVDEGCGRALPLETWNAVESAIGLPFPVPSIGALRSLYSHIGRSDVILLHDCLYLSNIAAFLFARYLNVPVIIVQHIGAVPYRNFMLGAIMKVANSLITRTMLGFAQQVVFISRNTAHYFTSIAFRARPAIVFNGVDTEMFRPLQEGESREAIRERMGLPRAGIVALFVGRFVEKKGISAMRRMVELRPEWTWAFAGWGPLHPGKWNATNVRVFSSLRGPTMAALYRACNLLVLPSTGEGFPLVVQEALASGLPVVCSAEILGADLEMGTYVWGAPVCAGNDDRTARGFLSVMSDVLEREEASTSESADRQAFARSRYSWEYATEQYMDIASRLVPEAVSHAGAVEADLGRVRR
jgi:glycosyltransferase involved in cell wall biosynthesis